jgi:pantoate--beta-alanine ligase
MRTLKTVEEIRRFSRARKAEGHRVALVPTMGYLHEGHLSLVREGKRRASCVLASIFVNPIQFGPREDLDRYPRDLPRDSALLEAEGVDALFAPEVEEMYPHGFATRVNVEGPLTEGLCGARRPGHFSGVATVVTKLFTACEPDVALFGQKDAQQAAVIRRFTRDLDLPVEIVVCPIVRERDGLAMSSRNVYLSPEERNQAPALFRSLRAAEALFASGERRAEVLLDTVRRGIARAPLARLDYAELVDADSLVPVQRVEAPALLALAVFFGSTRLIDNTVLSPSPGA